MFMIRFALNNPLLANLMVVLIVLAGLLSYSAMPQEMFPVVELDRVRITTVFKGASPEEIERQVTQPIEDEFDGIADIDEITSSSSEGVSNIIIKFKPGANVEDFLREARDALDRVTDLPETAEKPELVRLKTRFPVLSLALYGEVGNSYLVDLAERIKPRLLQIAGVAGVEVAGAREWELWIITDPQKLAALGVPLGMVNDALRKNLRDLPGGSIKAAEGDILLRGKGVTPEPAQVEEIVLRRNAQGGELLLGQVARVERRLEEAKTLGRFNGKASINLTINKTTDSSTIDVSQRVRAFADELRKELPASVQVGLFSDLSRFVKERLEVLQSSGLVGLILVLLTLYLFLNSRVALVAAMGIPVGFMFAMILLHYFGYTLNMISMFAFLVVLGRLVDDSIIVTENIYRHLENGDAPQLAAERGAREIYWPVVASTFTTIAAFLPMLAIGGTMGAFIAVIPVVVSLALFGSLLEAFAILPTQAAFVLRVAKQETRRRWIDWGAWLNRYLNFLRWSMNNRNLVTLATFGILLISLIYAGTRMQFELFGRVESSQFYINAEAPVTYRLEDTAALAARMEKVILGKLRKDELKTLQTNIGITMTDFSRVRFNSNYMQFIVDLSTQAPKGFIEAWVAPFTHLNFHPERGTRERASETIINEVQIALQALPGIQRLSILRPEGGPAGSDIEIGVTGPDIEGLGVVARRVSDYLKQLPGARDVQSDLEPGKLELQYSLNERGRQLGLTQEALAEVVRTGFLGAEIMHVTSGDQRIPVRVIYPEEMRRAATSLRTLPMALPTGGVVYLGEVADIREGRSFDTVNRRDGRKLATVSAEVNRDISTALQVAETVRKKFANLSQEQPGYELVFLGEKKEANESMQGMSRAALIALALIFIILAALFKSLLDPLVVMFAIPYGAIGVIFGHALLGYNLQFLSLIGALALAGVVVNNSLLLIDVSNKLSAQGWTRADSLVEACRVRIRPILLTSITTILGISPLIFFASGSTAFLSPTAVSLGFGLLVSTVLTLVALPCFYLIADDMRRWTGLQMRRLWGAEESNRVQHEVR
ncbi:MAG: efflux RND transporter permease subunit [Gammaproteobacteria bacterium]